MDINGLEPGFESYRRQGDDTDRGWEKSIYSQTIQLILGIQITF